MRKLGLGIILATAGTLWAMPTQAAEISVVALPNPIGIPEIIFLVALCGFALWKTSWLRVVLSICIIIWGVFFAPYDLKIAGPAIAVGTVLFINGIMDLVGRMREGREV